MSVVINMLGRSFSWEEDDTDDVYFDIFCISDWMKSNYSQRESIENLKLKASMRNKVLVVIENEKITEVLVHPGFSLKTNFLLFDEKKKKFQSSSPLDMKFYIFLYHCM